MSPFWRSRRSRRAALGAATAAVAAACATAPYRGITEAADAPSITSTSVPTDVLGTTTVRPAPASTTTAATPTTAAPTTAPPSTTAAPTTTRPPATTAPARSGTHAEPIAAGARVEIPDAWTVAAPPPTGAALASLLPGLAPQLDAAGVLGTVRFVASDRTAGGAVAPSVVVTELPRAPGATALGTLATVRAAIGPPVASSTPAPQSSALGDGAYVTYQVTTGVDASPVTIVSEHYAFVRGDTILVVMMTTTAERAASDGRVFGRMLASLAPTA